MSRLTEPTVDTGQHNRTAVQQNAKTQSAKTKARPPRRLLRRLIFALGCLLLAIGVISYFTRPARLNRVLVDMLEQSIGCRATVGTAHLTWDGLLTVEGIDLTIPDAQGEFARLLHTDRVAVQLRLWPLVLGQVRAASVALNQPTLYLTEDLDHDRFNFEMLLARDADQDKGSNLPDALPELRLNGGQICFGQQVDGQYHLIESMQMDGKLTADPAEYGAYNFQLRQREPVTSSKQAAGPAIKGKIDLNKPMVQFEVLRFSFDGPYSYLLPQASRRWWKRLSPRGDLPRVEFSARRDEQQKVLLSAQMQLEQIGLSLPLGADRPMELSGVSGVVKLADEGEVSFEGVSGEVEGIGFKADGRIGVLSQDAPFEISLTTETFDLPAEGGVWQCLPENVRKYRERFNPQGTYQTSLVLERTADSPGIKLRGHLDLIDTSFMYYRFKYPAKQLTGRISFDNDRVILNDLVGITPTGAKGIVSGSIGPPIKDGVVAIQIRGEDVPLDENLVMALKPKRRQVLDMFFSREGYEHLLSEGVIRAPNEGASVLGEKITALANEAVSIEDQADDDVPVFVPGGTASMTVHINRAAGPGQEYRVTTDLQAQGLSSLFKFWHYPLVAEGGRIIISPDEVQVLDLRLRALNGGGGIVKGRLILPSEDQPLKPNLQLTSILLPVDRLLVASIPEPKDQWVRALNLSGELFGSGEVFADASGEVLFTVDAQLRDGRSVPNTGRYALEDIRGSVTIERTRIQFENFTGHHGPTGSITLNGQADYGETGMGVNLTFLADELPIERGLIDLLPPENRGRPLLEEVFNTYRPEGVTDARLVYEGGRDAPDRFSLEAQPESLNFDYKDQRIELTDLTGSIELMPDLAKLHHVAGRYTSGSFKVDGEARFGEEPGLALTFKVDAQRIDAPARALLPNGVRNLIDRLSLQGPFVLDDARLLTWPEVVQGPTGIFEGRVGFRGATARLGVPITEMDADMDVRVVSFVGQAWPHTDVQLTAKRLRASDRLVQRVSMHAQTGEQPWLINLKDLKGTVYGGTMIGHGQVQLAESPSLGFDLTIQEVQLEPFLKPMGDRASAYAAADEPNPDVLPLRDMSSGLLSSGLSVRVPFNSEQPIEGRGIVIVRDAKLYDKPWTLALLQAANLALPNESSFDRASARYLIYGDNVIFDDIRFEAPSFVIAGSGRMDYPSMDLNLRMVTHNPGAPDLGPVSELVRTFKDQLLAIEVRGTLAEPKAGVIPLEGVFRSWDRIFGNTSARVSTVHTEEPVPTE